MKQTAIDKAQDRLDKMRRKADRATTEVRKQDQKDMLAERAAYDLKHPPIEQAKKALAANDAEIERLRAAMVSEDVLEAMAVDSASLSDFIANAPTPMAPEAVAELARRMAEIDQAVIAAAKAVGVETDNRIVINQWVEMNPERTAEIFTSEIVAMMQAAGEYRTAHTPAPRQTAPLPSLRRVQGPIDPTTKEHTYTIEVQKADPMTRIGDGRGRYLRVIAGVDEYADAFSEMLAEPEEETKTEAAPAKQMRIEP